VPDTGRSSSLSYKTRPSGLVAKEQRVDDLEGGRTLQAHIKSFVRHSHRTAPELERFAFRILENRVVLKTKLRRAIRIGIGLRPESLLKGANWAKFTGFRKQCPARRAGSFGITVRIRIPVHVWVAVSDWCERLIGKLAGGSATRFAACPEPRSFRSLRSLPGNINR
jgi:hypothetical protein